MPIVAPLFLKHNFITMDNKYILIPVLVAVFLYGVFWTFNHVNPWVSIGLFIAGVITVNQILKNKKVNK